MRSDYCPRHSSSVFYRLAGPSTLTNMKNFNGKRGCLYCTNSGKTEHGDPLHRFWPNDPSSVLRAKESFLRDGKLAFTTGQSVSPTVMYVTYNVLNVVHL